MRQNSCNFANTFFWLLKRLWILTAQCFFAVAVIHSRDIYLMDLNKCISILTDFFASCLVVILAIWTKNSFFRTKVKILENWNSTFILVKIWCLLIFSMNAERSVTRYWFGTKMAFLWVFCLFSNLPVYVAKLRKQNKARNFEFSRQFSFVILDNLCPAFLWCFCDCFLNDIGREVCHAI